MHPCSARSDTPAPFRLSRNLAFLFPLLLLAACDKQDSTTPEASPTPTSTPSPTPTSATPTSAATTPGTALDLGALLERDNPIRVLDYYAAALAAGEWSSAARAWGEETGMTAEKLKAEFGGKGLVALGIVEGQADAAAGSLFYQAPVILRFGDGEERPGIIILRRVNNVDGATAEQLRWHIAGSSFEANPQT